jgi:hypothetical protein
MKTCPFCKESIQSEASICPHCRKRQPSIIRDLVTGILLIAGICAGIWYWSLRPFIQADEKQISREQRMQALRAQATPEMRKKFALGAEEMFLDHSFDAQFSTSGKDQTTLRFKVPYFSRVEVHTIANNLDWETIKALGFKKVIYTDGEKSATWDVP